MNFKAFNRSMFSRCYQILKGSKLKPLSGYGQRLAAQCEVYLGLQALKETPILIYQMGKVGSTSVSHSLKAAHLKSYVFDIHFLSEDLWKYRKLYIDSGIVPVPYHIELGLALRKKIISDERFKKFKIISLVRDPVTRQISDVFQNPEIMETDIRSRNGFIDPNKALIFLREKLSSLRGYDYVFQWFDRELKSVFGFDVFAEPFNRDSGWSVYHHRNIEILIMRMEELSTIGGTVISEFLNTPDPIELLNANFRLESLESQSYSYVKNAIKLDRELCQKIYESRFVRHFYSEKHIDIMKARAATG